MTLPNAGDVGWANVLNDAITAKLDGTGTRTVARTVGDGLSGRLDWDHQGTSGYLIHVTAGAGSGSGTAAIGVGTDQGNGYGILISAKSAGGRGLQLGVQPGSGIGMYVTGRSTSIPVYFELNPGSGPVLLQASSTPGWADGNTTTGSTTFTSASANFTSADVGATITQLASTGEASNPDGCIPAGATITAVASSTSVTMSANAGATGTAIRFAITGRTKPTTESMLELRNESSVTLHKLTKAGLSLTAGDTAQEPLAVTGAASQSARIFAVRVNGNSTPALEVGFNGFVSSRFGTEINNSGTVGADPLTARTYSSHPSLIALRDPAATGDQIQFRGSGSTALSRVNRDGYYMTAKNAAPADADVNANELAFWFDSTNGAAKLMVKAKQADGTVRTGSLALA